MQINRIDSFHPERSTIFLTLFYLLSNLAFKKEKKKKKRNGGGGGGGNILWARSPRDT